MDEVGFIDAEQEYSTNVKGLSFQQLVLRHLEKISKICTSEFRAGYWMRKPVTMGQGVFMSEIYIEDKRDAYINSVDFLNDVLLPYFDGEMNKESEAIEEKISKLKKDNKNDKDLNNLIYQKLLIKRELFQQLSLLLSRLGYLEAKRLSQ